MCNDNERGIKATIEIPVGVTRKELIQLADNFVEHTHDPEKKTHRTIEQRIQRGYNKLDQNPDKKRMPFDVMLSYCTVILDMCMDEKVDDKFAVDVATRLYNDKNEVKFTVEEFKASKYDRRKDIKKLIEVLKEQHPLIQQMERDGIWVESYAKNSTKVSEVVTYIKKCSKAYKELKEAREKEEAYRIKSLDTEISLIEMRAKYGEIKEYEKKYLIVQACKEAGLTQQSTAEHTGISLGTVKRKW